MKIIKKEMIEQRNQQIHTRAERKILENMRCPFIVQLHYAFQSLYLIMDFMIGGELFFHLRREKKFS
jgi:serine/threonine protein kinase